MSKFKNISYLIRSIISFIFIIEALLCMCIDIGFSAILFDIILLCLLIFFLSINLYHFLQNDVPKENNKIFTSVAYKLIFALFISVIISIFLQRLNFFDVGACFFIFLRFILFYRFMPYFVGDVLRCTKKNNVLKNGVSKSEKISYYPFIFLIPMYLGVWANDIMIIRAFNFVVFFNLLFKLNISKYLRIFSLIVIGSIICFIPNIGFLVPLSILISVFLILHFNKKAQSFSLTVVSLIALLRIFIVCYSPMFNFTNNLSYVYTKLTSFFISGGTPLGLSISGFELFLSLLLAIIFYLKIKNKLIYIYPLIVFSIIYTFFLFTFPIFLEHLPKLALNLRVIILLFFIFMLAVFEKYFGDGENTINLSVESDKNIKPYLLVLLCIMISIVFFKPIFINNYNQNKRIAIVGSTDIANLTPINNYPYENFLISPGYAFSPTSFGTMEMYMKMFGYEVDTYDSLDGIVLENYDCFILVHYNESPSSILKDQFKNFVAKGGVVWAISDHTNIFNSMQGTNELLHFSNITIQDDISDSLMHYTGKVWDNSLSWNHCFCTSSSKTSNDLGVWGGASVDSINFFDESIIIASYGLSDPGDHTVIGEQNSGMRNRKFDIGEKCGDIPLVIKSYYKKGKIIVFGDGSYFQIPSLMYNWNFISKLMYECLYDNTTQHILFVLLQLLVIGIICLIVLYLNCVKFQCYVNKTFIGLCICSFVVMNIANNMASNHIENRVFTKFKSEYFTVDSSHNNYYSKDLMVTTDISGFGYNAMKLGIPIICTDNWLLMNKSKAIIIINPQTPITTTETGTLEKYMGNSNAVLIITGGIFSENLDTFFNNFRINIKNVFLGPLPWKNANFVDENTLMGPEFKEAWNIEFSDNTEPYYEYLGFIPVSKTKVGNGLLYVLADNRFISQENLEGEMTGNIQNIKFITELFKNISEL